MWEEKQQRLSQCHGVTVSEGNVITKHLPGKVIYDEEKYTNICSSSILLFVKWVEEIIENQSARQSAAYSCK